MAFQCNLMDSKHKIMMCLSYISEVYQHDVSGLVIMIYMDDLINFIGLADLGTPGPGLGHNGQLVHIGNGHLLASLQFSGPGYWTGYKLVSKNE